jgi:excinuclease ABC subunit A
MKKRKGTTLYLFDEPSTGLHYFDILKLLEVFESIVGRGDTVLFIEHNSAMIEFADRVVKLGPGSGDEGGEVL